MISDTQSRRMGLTVLGSTGSIGVSTLDVIARNPGRYRAVALTAHRSSDLLFEQCIQHRPDLAVLGQESSAAVLRSRLRQAGCATEVLAGPQALERVASLPEVDAVMAAIVGAAGLLPTLAAARAGKRVLLANKEALVMSGRLFMEAVSENHATLLPIDSEHNAIFQCLPGNFHRGLKTVGVEKILLTASGGPFRNTPLDRLSSVTPDEACAHPNWSMGRKISVDSATMMNKGLEIIEACWLFNARPEQVEVVLHPQSVIHSMVSYTDGSVLAELGNPDMRTPIAHALAWPERIDSGVKPLDLFAVGRLDFQVADVKRFPCLKLARDALQAGGSAPAVLNAANEVAVQAFLDGRVSYTDIARIIEHALEKTEDVGCETLDAVLSADRESRRHAQGWAESLPRRAVV